MPDSNLKTVPTANSPLSILLSRLATISQDDSVPIETRYTTASLLRDYLEGELTALHEVMSTMD